MADDADRGKNTGRDSLICSPRLQQAKVATISGTLEEGVRLTIVPADCVPHVPNLMLAGKFAEKGVGTH
jgi:hypothetical protein